VLRVTATSNRHRTLTMFCSSASESFIFSKSSPHAARNTTPAGTSPVVARRHKAISNLRARATIIVCGFCHPQFESDTPGLMHCPSERAKNAKPTESFPTRTVRCPPWQALSPPFAAALVGCASETSIARKRLVDPAISARGPRAPAMSAVSIPTPITRAISRPSRVVHHRAPAPYAPGEPPRSGGSDH